MTIAEIRKKYYSKIDALDLELIIAHGIGKTREFVLAHPEYVIPATRNLQPATLIKRRMKHEPLAYILGHKEFFGLDFKVNKAVLVPRPETEMLVEEVLKLNPKNKTILDIGTGSGNIIISLVENLKNKNKFIATDISAKALAVAKQNAKFHKVDKKIEFLHGDSLEPIIKSTKYEILDTKYIIAANLPYLSEKIYASTARDVKNFEPKSALLSGADGLDHYRKLFRQIRNTLYLIPTACYIEISPEQKPALEKLVGSALPGAKAKFIKDLTGKWRVCHILLGF